MAVMQIKGLVVIFPTPNILILFLVIEGKGLMSKEADTCDPYVKVHDELAVGVSMGGGGPCR